MTHNALCRSKTNFSIPMTAMNKLTTLLSGLVLAGLASVTISSCTSSTSPGTTNTVQDNVSAQSHDANSIDVSWTRASGDTGPDTVVATIGGTVANSVIVASPGNTAVVGGLSEGLLYSISVHSTSGTSATPVLWMTARRSTTIRLYETADNTPGHFSGLDLANMKAVSVSGGANIGVTDFVLASWPTADVASGLSLEAADAQRSGFSSGGRASIVDGSVYYVSGGIDNLYFTGNLRSLIDTVATTEFNSFDLPIDDGHSGQSAILLVRTADDHFALIQIVPQANGQLYGGTPGTNYIDVVVSYQNTVDAPYASRAHINFPRGGHHPVPSGQ
jgi:hypothetical protein